MTSSRTVRKVRTLRLALRTARVLAEQRSQKMESSPLPSGDWRYMQAYLSPEVLLHLDESIRPNDSMYKRESIGFILIPEMDEWVNAREVDLEEWLGTPQQQRFGEAVEVLRSRIPTLKSRGGRQKAERLLDDLTAMLSGS